MAFNTTRDLSPANWREVTVTMAPQQHAVAANLRTVKQLLQQQWLL